MKIGTNKIKVMKQKTIAVTILECGFTALTSVLGIVCFGRFIYAILFNQ